MNRSAVTRRRVTLGLLATGGLALPGWAGAQLMGWPTKPIRLVVPFPAGGPTDIVARPVAQMLGDRLKTQVVVDNRGGAGGSIGADIVARSASDGYTLLMGTVGTAAINVSLYRKLMYDPVRDFTPIAMVASAPVALVCHPGQPFNTAREMIAAAKAKPGALSFGTAGNGTPGHLTGAMFEAAAGVKLQHVPYKGSAPAVTDLVGGPIALMVDPPQSVISNVQAGKLRALAVSSRDRSPQLPDVPTFAEAGLTGFESTAWWAVFAPARMPSPLVNALKGEIEKIVASPQFRQQLGNLGVVPFTEKIDSLEAFQRREIVKWGKAVRDSGATLD
ncbi:MAG TPA: tripartite tricarboxylate transporter substrate binding protein [Burkholderiaceae bacterium]|nr:tripartite tricarboxylate transporter substrate binding protein [Burkholderiaceae bacterium]